MRLEFYFLLLTAIVAVTNADLKVFTQSPSAPLPSNGAPVDEVLVESSLYIKSKPKTNVRRTKKEATNFMHLAEHQLTKRSPQFGQQYGPQYGQQNNNDYFQSQAAANAASDSASYNPYGFGQSAANAIGQAFNSRGPAGGFGASAAGTITQSHSGNRFGGFQNSAGASHSQTYKLPNGQTINFASTNNFANSPGQNAAGRAGSVSVG